jgi:hypothetical protein
MWLIFCSSPQTVIQLTMIHMDQMILSEPSIVRSRGELPLLFFCLRCLYTHCHVKMGNLILIQ